MWNYFKYHVLHFKLYTSQPSNVVDLNGIACDENISTQHLINYTNHVVKEKEQFPILDHVPDNQIESFIIHLSGSNNSCDSQDDL